MKMQCLAPSLDNRNDIITSGLDKVEKVRISSKLAHSEKMATDWKYENVCFNTNIAEKFVIARISFKTTFIYF